MYKFAGAIGLVVITIICFYAFNSFFLNADCKWYKGMSCESISQVRADDGGDNIIENNQNLEDITQVIVAQSAMLKINEEQLRLNAQEIVSEKAVEQREYLKKSQIELELELERQIKYQAKLLEEGKIIVAEYEAERQVNLKLK